MTQPEPPQSAAQRYPRRWPAFIALLSAGFMNLIDVSIVNVALPRLQSGLGAASTQIEWVAAAYVLAFALGLLPFGRLGDRIGRKRMFLIGISGFTLMSLLCGLAPGMNTLILARVFQGLCGAMMMPQVLAIAQIMFPPEERGSAFSLFGMSAGLASVAGPLAGGLLINADLFGLDWRPIFLVNIPLGIGAFTAAFLLVPDIKGNRDIRNDWGGMAIAASSVFLLVFPLVEGHALGWPAWAFGMIGAGLVGACLFYLYESRQDRLGRSQLLPVGLIRNGSFRLGSAMTILFFSGVSGFFLIFAVFLQSGFGFSPLDSGLTTMPFPLGVLAASIASRRLTTRWPRQRIAAGALTLVVGMVFMRMQVGGIGETVDHWLLVPPLFLGGFGLGVGISPLFQTVLAAVPPRDAGSGSGALQSFQQMGNAVGIAINGQLFFSVLGAGVAAGATQKAAFVDGLETALFYEIAAFLVVAFLVVFLKAPSIRAAGAGEPRPVVAEI